MSDELWDSYQAALAADDPGLLYAFLDKKDAGDSGWTQNALWAKLDEITQLRADLAAARRNAQVWEQNYNKCHASLCAVNDRENEAVIKLTAARAEIANLLGHLEASNAAARRRGGERDAMRVALEKAPCGCTCPIHHRGWHSSGHCLAWWDGERNGECERVFCTRCLALGLDKVKGEPDGNAQSS